MPKPHPEEPPAERTLRHLRMCRELAELGMDMARNAHAAGNEWAAGSAHAANNEWAATGQQEPTQKTPRAHAQSGPTPANTPRRETASPSLAFARIVRAVHQIIALEIRVAADQAAKAERAADRASTHVYRLAAAAARRPAAPGQQPGPTSAEAADQAPPTQTAYPSLLATISRELGVNLEQPASTRGQPSVPQQTGPP